MAPSGDNDDSALSLFAAELQAARAKVAMTREELAARINYSASLIGMVETLHRVPRLDFAQRCDQVFGSPGTFARIPRCRRAGGHAGTGRAPDRDGRTVDRRATGHSP